MSKKKKITCILLFSFFICFMFIGYATLTDKLDILGSLEGESQKNVFIVDVIDETSNVNVEGFYSTLLDQTITLNSGESSEYIVKIYNNGKNKYIYDGYTCVELPDGIELIVKEKVGDIEVLNCISSLIDSNGYDYFIVVYTNNSSETVQIVSPVQFNYTELTTQIKVSINYKDEEYSKYTEKESDNVYDDIIFDQIDIDLSDNTKNLVARCNNGGILGLVEDNLTVSNITNYSEAKVGELDITVELFDSLTEAVNYNEGIFKDDISPNNFLVLQDINDTIESKTDSIIVLDDRNYSINLNAKEITIHKTIENNGDLKIYDSNINKGIILIEDNDLIHNRLLSSNLIIENVQLQLIDNSRTIYTGSEELFAIVTGYEGLVEIINSDLNSNYGYCIYKRSLNAGDSSRKETNYESKIVVSESNLISDYSNAVRFSDGAGIISLVNSYVASCQDLSSDASKMTDPIFVRRHYDEMSTDFDKFYQNSITDIKIYITGGMLVCNNKSKVNHYYSSSDLNARLFYTKSAQFKTMNDLSDTTLAAKTNDTSFSYPIAMINGNGALDSDLFIDKEERVLTNHYLNKDGWYYIKTTETDLNGTYTSSSYINTQIENNEYDYLLHNGKRVRVGDYFEMINFNNPGSYYINVDDYANTTDYYIGLTSIGMANSQGDFRNIEYLFTFLTSCDELYFNIASLGNLDCVFHIENRGSGAEPNGHNVGIKYISTNETAVKLDVKEQRFTLMKYNHANTIDETPPYVFVSQFESVLSYFIAKVGKRDENNNVIWTPSGEPDWDTTVAFGDHYLEEAGFKDLTVPGFLDKESPYEYPYELYLLSNYTSPKYQRNGWYLWEDATPTTLTDIWNEKHYYNFMTMSDTLTNGTNTLDDNTTVVISNQSTITNYGIILNANFNDSSSDNNYGYIRIVSQSKIYGMTLVLSIPSLKSEDTTPSTNNPWLLVRSYGYENGEYVRKDYPISGDIITGRSPYEDTDHNNTSGYPYYIELTRTETEVNIQITIMFDAEDTDYNLYAVVLDPFDDKDINSTIVLKTALLIGEVKDYLQ